MSKLEKLLFMILAVLVLSPNISYAATALSAGDIAFIGINSDGDDDFAFVLLKDIDSDTTVYITDKGWDDSGFTSLSGDGIWLWSADSSQSAGTIVHIKTTNNGTIESGSLAADPGTVSWVNGEGSTVISFSGDQVFLYQGTHANPVFITGIHYNVEPNLTSKTTDEANWDDTTQYNHNSALPDDLENGVNAIWVYNTEGTSQSTKERDNFRYKCSATKTGDPATLSTAINTLGNWDVDTTNSTAYTLNPFPCGFSVSAANSKPTASGFSPSPIYQGTAYAFETAQFSYSDPDGDPLSLLRVADAPGQGTLWVDSDGSGTVNGSEAGLSDGETVSKTELDSGRLKYLNTNGTSSSFKFEVNDGADYSESDYPVTLVVTPEPDVTLSLSPSSSISENGGNTDIQAVLSHSFNNTVTVDLSFSGTADGSDYSATGSSITITSGTTSDSVTLSGTNDSLDENNETVQIDISSVTNGNEQGVQQVTCTLIDDDAPPAVEFNSTGSNGLETVGSADLQVDLSAASGLNVTVDYAVTGTATGGGTDYTLADGTLTINAGETSGSITIAGIVDDVLDENNETVVVTLSNPGNATLGTDAVHTYTIIDNDESPAVTTNAATVVGETHATLNGMVNANGSGTTVTFEYGLTTGYGSAVAADESPVTGSVNTSVSKTISGLSPNTIYHFRVVGVNSTGTSYGPDNTFTTSSQVPVVITLAVTDITTTTTTGNGDLTDLGAPDPTAHGVCWNTGGSPTTSDSFTNEGAVSSTGEFASEITDLIPNTLYYVRAYATNAAGTFYGDEVSFRTQDDFPWMLFMPAITGPHVK